MQAGDKAQQLKQQATSGMFGGSLQQTVSFTPAANLFMLADMGNASLAGPQVNSLTNWSFTAALSFAVHYRHGS